MNDEADLPLLEDDWWFWESDERLHIDRQWVWNCRFPDSLREVCMELESLERRKNQIDWIAAEMVKDWHFQKQDGTIMSAREEDCAVSKWSGSSTWQGERWVRDETKPGTNEYYVKMVSWKPNPKMTEQPYPNKLEVPNSFPVMVGGGNASISIHLMEQAGIPCDLPVDEILRRIQEWQVQEAEQRRQERIARREARRARWEARHQKLQ